jgi:eukaryotic-like serine/threonine-protein kinase
MKLSTDSKTDLITHITIILLCFLALFFAFFFLYLPWVTNHNEIVKVPQLQGMSIEQATEVLDAANLDYEVSDCTFVSGKKPMSVLSIFPKAGMNVKTGRKIYLTVAAASAPMVKMPNITGRSVSSAKNQLLSSKLIFDKEEKISALEENTVLKIKIDGQEIQAGQLVPEGSRITLCVGDGYGSLMMDAPGIVGMPLDEAQTLLEGQGLSLGEVTTQASDQPEGTVLKQSPGAGAKIKNGSPINLWVAGAASTEPPTVNNN